jgi:CheY-like chemotaxis protein
VTPAPPARRIIVVDDEEALAWSLASRLRKARPRDRIEIAHDGESALACIEDGDRLDLLIADIRMPGMSGIELILAARGIHPNLPVIVMTAFSSNEIKRVETGPFTGFLEKPFDFERLRVLVDEAFATPLSQDEGFSGAISVQTLPDVVQLYVLSNASGVLRVSQKRKDRVGHIYFGQGAILHAAAPNAKGNDAFYEIMTWSGGEFSMELGVAAPERSVTSNWQELLMESVRRIDEIRRAEPPTSIGRTGWTQAPPPGDDIDSAFGQLELARPAPPIIETATPHDKQREIRMNIKDSLTKLNQIDGFVGAALVDSESGMLLGQEGGGNLNLEVAAAGNTEVVRAKRKTMESLALKDGIEDILITLGKQYHLIRPLRSRNKLFFYVALDRQRSNLAMARIALADVEKELQV